MFPARSKGLADVATPLSGGGSCCGPYCPRWYPAPTHSTQYNYPLPNRRKCLLVTAQQPEMYLKLKDRGHRGAGEDIEDPKEPRVAGSG